MQRHDTLDLISYKGYAYPLICEGGICQAISEFLFHRNPSIMGGFVWNKVRVTRPDGTRYYVRRKQ